MNPQDQKPEQTNQQPEQWEDKTLDELSDIEADCCGGDYCTGDHNQRLLAFIRKTREEAKAEERREVLDEAIEIANHPNLLDMSIPSAREYIISALQKAKRDQL